MKEVLKKLSKATGMQENQLYALSRTAIAVTGLDYVLELHPGSTARIEISESLPTVEANACFLNMLRGGIKGLQNELIHPLIKKQNGKYFRGTNRKMQRLVKIVMQEAEDARFELKQKNT